ncbi:hypothetical protein BPOR_0465g00090 [Botrytis porri]|uniref:Uncharacterized protein n=1 Tax=Botrytis porri TaxID=87229 RepID=A0A4Z1KRQ3_9HELO|nr:hypothetical protein BPOR_0465g00090 [Botrytis porri]
MSNQPEKEEFPGRDGHPVARHRSPASGSDAPNLVVSDRAEPANGRSTSNRSLHGASRAVNSLRGRQPSSRDPYDMNKYHAINENGRRSYTINSDTTINNGPAGNPPPYNPAPAPAPDTVSSAIPATRMAVAPASAPPIAPAVPVSRFTRSRTQKQTFAAIKKNVKKQAAKEPIAKKPAARKQAAKRSATRKPTAKESTAKYPWRSRSGFGIFRVEITEVELAFIRSGYGTLLCRKKTFKNAPPGAYRNAEITFNEIQLLWSNRDNGGEERQAYYDNPKTEEMKEAMLRASKNYERRFEKDRAKAIRKGFPDAMPLADRFPIVALAAAAAASSTVPVVAGNAADSTEDQDMADDDLVSPESSLYSDSEDEDMEKE